MKKETENIYDDDSLLRRVPFMDPNYIRDDGTLTSFAFSLKHGEKGISVNIERLTTYEKSILDVKRFRLYFVQAKVPITMGLECIRDPVSDNYAHALIKGEIKRPISKKLSAAAKRIKYPA